eukprot:m.29344 g.29344  ORF g.29344 m.29344 type:complete len:65 (+) comp6142_c0_seq1:1112-1306(+)
MCHHQWVLSGSLATYSLVPTPPCSTWVETTLALERATKNNLVVFVVPHCHVNLIIRMNEGVLFA